jgi:hypothetical protein
MCEILTLWHMYIYKAAPDRSANIDTKKVHMKAIWVEEREFNSLIVQDNLQTVQDSACFW